VPRNGDDNRREFHREILAEIHRPVEVMNESRMKSVVKMAAHGLYGAGLLIMLALPTNRYGWMQDMDPSVAQMPVDNDTGSRAIAGFLLLVILIASELIVARNAGNKKERLLAVVLLTIPVIVWIIKFY